MAPSSAFPFKPIPPEKGAVRFETKSDNDGKIRLTFNAQCSPKHEKSRGTPLQILKSVVPDGVCDTVDDWDDTYYPTHHAREGGKMSADAWTELDSLVADHFADRLRRGHMAVVSYGNEVHLKACLQKYPKTSRQVLYIDSPEQLSAGEWAHATPRRAIVVSARDLYGEVAKGTRGAERADTPEHRVQSKRLAMQAYLDALPREQAPRPLVAMGDDDTDFKAVAQVTRLPGQVAVNIKLEEWPELEQLIDELSEVRALFKELTLARDLFAAPAPLLTAGDTLGDKPAATASETVSAEKESVS